MFRADGHRNIIANIVVADSTTTVIIWTSCLHRAERVILIADPADVPVMATRFIPTDDGAGRRRRDGRVTGPCQAVTGNGVSGGASAWTLCSRAQSRCERVEYNSIGLRCVRRSHADSASFLTHSASDVPILQILIANRRTRPLAIIGAGHGRLAAMGPGWSACPLVMPAVMTGCTFVDDVKE